jgi:transcriptional regulator with XRE-family HTH domain
MNNYNNMKYPELIALGKHIRHLRQQKGYTQEAFAEAADIDRSYYGRIERGEHNVTYLCLLKIIRGLGFQKKNDLDNVQDFFKHTR